MSAIIRSGVLTLSDMLVRLELNREELLKLAKASKKPGERAMAERLEALDVMSLPVCLQFDSDLATIGNSEGPLQGTVCCDVGISARLDTEFKPIELYALLKYFYKG